MKRLQYILALSHGCLASGAIGLYANPNYISAVLIAIGAFTRWMVPGDPAQKNEHKEPLFTIGRYALIWLMAKWLLPLGLSEVIDRAWQDRLSLSPIVFFTSILLYLIAKDWMYFIKLAPNEVDAFYESKNH